MKNEQLQKTQHQIKAPAAQKSAIDALQKFYGLVVAVAFTGGVLKFIDGFNMWNWSADRLTQILLFIAFVSTIVPFYHGMERHLFETHVARNDINWGHGGRPSNILLDIFAFMFMGALFLSMGRRIDAPYIFLQIWSALLILDIVWSLIVWRYQKGTKPIWAWNNFIWLALAWIAWYGTSWIFAVSTWHISWILVAQTGAIAIIEISRSVFDYKLHWHFYFPDGRTVAQDLVYLASPYSNDAPLDPGVPASAEKRVARFNAVTEVARRLVEDKTIVYSPLTMTHPIDVRMNHDPGSDFWVSFDEMFMQHCNRIYILQLPGWDKSSGVEREIKYFSERGINPTFVDPAGFGVSAEKEKFKAAFK